MRRHALAAARALPLALSPAAAFPGDAHLHPTIHFTPSHVSDRGGWHDVAGAVTHKGVHHIYMGTGWNHHLSDDLVSWKMGPHGPNAVHETYAGMDSKSDPCSGYVTKDDNGAVCAGFRQCGSNRGVAGGNNWDVPLELRCALDDDLTAWNDAAPDYLFNVSWWRGIPYDPARPWKEDGMWYQLISMDGCNATEVPHKLPCHQGGELVMWKSPVLRGAGAKWEKVGNVFETNATVLKTGHLSKEFVTIDYIGKLEGDPSPKGDTRLFLNNVGGNGGGDGCCSGTTNYFVVKQPAGGSMTEVRPQGMVDWGSFAPLGSAPDGAHGVDLLRGTASRGLSMARTLGSEEADQVTKPGRRVLIGWTGPADGSAFKGQGSAQSLPRDLSLAPDSSLVQRFVPELQALRREHTRVAGAAAAGGVAAGLQAEVLVSLPASCGAAGPPAPATPAPADAGWHAVASKGTFGTVAVGKDAFDAAFASSPTKIVRRVCAGCDAENQVVYYKRHTPLQGLDLYDCLRSNWSDTPSNLMHTDFDLYSTYADATNGANAWGSCNFDDYENHVGAFRDCGKSSASRCQWNTFAGSGACGGGQADVAFHIDASGGSHPEPSMHPARAGCKVELLTGGGDGKVEVTLDAADGLVYVDATSLGNTAARAGPLPPPADGGYHVHAYVDHSIVELIVNNATAFVVYAAPSASAGGVAATAVSGQDAVTLDVWTLASANNTDGAPAGGALPAAPGDAALHTAGTRAAA